MFAFGTFETQMQSLVFIAFSNLELSKCLETNVVYNMFQLENFNMFKKAVCFIAFGIWQVQNAEKPLFVIAYLHLETSKHNEKQRVFIAISDLGTSNCLKTCESITIFNLRTSTSGKTDDVHLVFEFSNFEMLKNDDFHCMFEFSNFEMFGHHSNNLMRIAF